MRPSCYEIMRLTEILLAQAKRRSGRGVAAPGAAAPNEGAASPSAGAVAGPSVQHWAAGPAAPHQQALQQQRL